MPALSVWKPSTRGTRPDRPPSWSASSTISVRAASSSSLTRMLGWRSRNQPLRESKGHRPYSRRAVNVRCSRRSGYVLSFCQSWNQAEYAGFDLDTLLNAVLPHSHRRMPPVFWGAARRYRGRSIGGLHAVEGRRGMVVARERLAPAFLFGTPRYGNRSSPMWFSTGTLPEPRGHASSPVGVGCRFIPVRFDL